MFESMEDKEKALYMAIAMYDAAGRLPDHMKQDSNAIAAKAKALMNKALEGVIEINPENR